MIDKEGFRGWLRENTELSDKVIRDTVSRMSRVDAIRAWSKADTYLFKVEQADQFKDMTLSVKSQCRKAVRLYTEFAHSK